MTARRSTCRSIPPLGEPRPQPAPEAHETTLPNGLRLVVVPRPGRPADRAAAAGAVRRAAPPAARGVHTARGAVLSGAVLLGTSGTTRPASPSCCRATARSCRSPPTPTGCCSPPRCCPAAWPRCSGVLAELLTDATYPDDRVEGERDRVAERIAIARSQPGVIARTALAARRYGSHPYAIQLPDARPRRCDVTAPRRCARLHRERVAARRQQPRAGRRPRPARGHGRRRRRAGGLVGDRAGRRGAAGARRCSPPGIAAGRPARAPCSPTSGSAARPPAAPTRDLPAAAAGQHGLRRLLLLAAGREHPRAARLHLQPAQLASTTRRPARRSWSRPTSPPR